MLDVATLQPDVSFRDIQEAASMAEMVKGFGCLLAYESLSCRNPWSAGVALWVLLFWGDRVRASNRG
ncbi:hypothetical protein WH91_16970, partial [Devosia psychrophila]